MDPVTHSFLGGSLSAAGLRRRTALATPTLILAANAPDIDIVAQFFGSYAALAWRRGITHGAAALLVLPFVVAGGVLLWDRWRRWRGSAHDPGNPARPLPLLALAFIGVWSHPFFDWVNNYGMRWLAPFSGRWYYGDAIFIVDPWLWLLLGGPLFLLHSHGRRALLGWTLLGGAMTMLVLLVSLVPMPARLLWVAGVGLLIALRAKRVGLRGVAGDGGGPRPARIGVGVAFAYVLAMVFLTPLSERIVAREAAAAGLPPLVDLMVGPLPADPFHSEVILRIEGGYRRGHFSWFGSPRLELDPTFLHSAPRNAAVEAAESDPRARDFLTWSRFPLYTVRPSENGWTVEIQDVRYLDRGSSAITGVRVEVPAPGLFETTFEAAWERVRDTYYDPEMRGIDWEGVRRELRPQAAAAETPGELRAVIRAMLARLGESHFVLIPGGQGAPVVASGAEGDPGLEFRWIDGDLLVSSVREAGPAARAGVRTGWVLESIDGVSVDSLLAEVRASALPGEGEGAARTWLPLLARSRAVGEAATPLALTLLDAGDRTVEVELVRTESTGEVARIGSLPPIRVETEEGEVPLSGGGRVGVVRWTAWVPSINGAIAEAIDRFRDADGIVLDLRGNAGGLGAMAMGIGGHFLSGAESLGTMVTREAELRFVTNPQRVGPSGERIEPYAGPLAILVDPLSASTSEIFAAGLQALERARVFGEGTAGQALPALVTELPNGDRLMHVVADFIGPDGTRLEGIGVVPDSVVAPDRLTLLAGEDPVLEAALAWIRTQR